MLRDLDHAYVTFRRFEQQWAEQASEDRAFRKGAKPRLRALLRALTRTEAAWAAVAAYHEGDLAGYIAGATSGHVYRVSSSGCSASG